MIPFGKFIKQKRLAANLTQKQVAEHLGYNSQEMISYLENDRRFWQLNHVVKLAELFNMPASELIKEWVEQ